MNEELEAIHEARQKKHIASHHKIRKSRHSVIRGRALSLLFELRRLVV